MSFMYILDLWNIRGFVIVSLLLQIFLILYAPIRKQSRNNGLLWSAYLMANWVAPFAIGLISRNQGNSSAGAIEVEGALHAFWVSFLLLHFGCPDTMGAFSTEDSKLWGRYLASFIFQLGAAIYVFVKICPSDKSLVIPTILVLFAALIKNVERLWALYLTNIPRLREWALSKHTLSDVLVKLVEELDVPRDGYSNEEETKLVESIVVKHAYYFFQIFKIFLIDLVFTRQQREISREYFCKVSALDAMRIISVELQFMYEVLHTKLLAIHSKWSYIFRFIAFTNIVVAYVLFNRLKKNRLPELDVKITYALLLGGIALDVIALVMLVFSDWNVGRIKCCNTGSSKLDLFFHKLVSSLIDLKKPRFATCKVEPKADATNVFLDTPFIFRRWSESIYASNLFSEFLNESPRKMYKHNRSWGIIFLSDICYFPFGMAKKIIFHFHKASEKIGIPYGPRNRFLITKMEYVSNPFIKKLWIFIFEKVKQKSKNAITLQDVKNIFEARGNLFLQSIPGQEDFLAHVTNINYDNSIISWHIATEIWYNTEKWTIKKEEREFSKILSDYMLYLLLNKHDVVSAVVGVAQMKSAKVMHELFNYIGRGAKDINEICQRLCDVHSIRFDPQSVVKEGVELAQKMQSLNDMKWEVMSGVWVEMLSYAAIHIKGEAHAQVLTKGGELLAFVWLLMAHFGCFYTHEWGMYREFWDERYVINERDNRDDSDASSVNNEYST